MCSGVVFIHDLMIQIHSSLRVEGAAERDALVGRFVKLKEIRHGNIRYRVGEITNAAAASEKLMLTVHIVDSRCVKLQGGWPPPLARSARATLENYSCRPMRRSHSVPVRLSIHALKVY